MNNLFVNMIVSSYYISIEKNHKKSIEFNLTSNGEKQDGYKKNR